VLNETTHSLTQCNNVLSLLLKTQPNLAELKVMQEKNSLEEIQAEHLSNQRLKQILDNLFAYVALLDLDGMILEVNQAPLVRGGFTREQVLGRYFYDAPWWNYDDDVRNQLIAAIEDAKRGQIRRYDVYVNMQGQLEPLDFQISPVRNAAGEIIALLPTAVDITERKAMELAQRQFESIVQSSDDAIISKTLAGIVVSWNPGAERMFGYSASEMIGNSMLRAFPADREEEEKYILEQISRGQKLDHFESVRSCKDGSMIDVSISVSPIYDDKGNITGASTIARDITRNKQLEKDLITAKQAAEKANQAKSKFVASMNHELRTPMNAILGFAQLLALDNLSENQKDSVQHIITAGHHLMDLINQVLDLAKIEADKLELNLEEISLTFLIQNCLNLVQPLTLKNQIKLIDNSGMGHHTLVIVDKLRFKQVLLNLISNAIKYNRTAGSVTIATKLIQPQRLRISITDTGNGLSKEQIDKLFQPFERLTAKNSQIEGTGIGLCISKKLIEAMDGRIGVESEEGEGSCFWIEIPIA
jgi:PAS domain S-box-containing protein